MPCHNTNNTELLSAYNTAMDEIARKIPSEREPLTSQLECWEKSSAAEQQHMIQKATDDCMPVCNVIAPNDGKQLFQAMMSENREKPHDEAIVDDVVKVLMIAYKNAKNRNTKTQILSLYAYKY